MVALAEANPSVGIVGAYGLQATWVLWQGVPYGSSVVSGREICRQRLLGGPDVFGSDLGLFAPIWSAVGIPFTTSQMFTATTVKPAWIAENL